MPLSPHQFMLAVVAMATQTLRHSQDIIMVVPYSLRSETGTDSMAGCLLDRAPSACDGNKLIPHANPSSPPSRPRNRPLPTRSPSQPSASLSIFNLAEVMVTLHPATGYLDQSFGHPFSLRPSGAKIPVSFEFFQNKHDISMVLEHDEEILTSQDSDCLLSTFQLVLVLMAQQKNVEEMVSAVFSEVHHPTVIPDGPVESHRISDVISCGAGPKYMEAIREDFSTCPGINTHLPGLVVL
ncbi:hypothetical protein PENCOP_c006G05981 [Penicillium coprophilum]|uniref:Uncharacterized protein n=1 Tax=Penicillium coprophilum TaxID=36646 RepID=A0A1V6UNB8_9EURO|nr:hypothetical protein PENCOP_c006G05981 [Penicillium coprophilum]